MKLSLNLALIISLIGTNLSAVSLADRITLDVPSGQISPQELRYELNLSLIEFSILHSAASQGVGKYGGDATFSVKLAKVGEDVVWTITITNPRLMDVWKYWMAEKTASIVSTANLDNMSEESKLALKTVQALNVKIASSLANPIYDPFQLPGQINVFNSDFFIESDRGRYRLTGSMREGLERWIGKSVVATGSVRTTGEFHLEGLLEKRGNTLELVVMSLCPYAKVVESAVIEFINNHAFPAGEPPVVEVHYLFYRKLSEGKYSFASLHGEDEIIENLVQMSLRDFYPNLYWDYLLMRANNDASWERLAREVGLHPEDIEMIEVMIEHERGRMIEEEYEYLTGRYGIYDGSPSFIWEGQRIADLRSLEQFANIDLEALKCAESQ